MNYVSMSEESMQRMEASIPELAGSALELAYAQALKISGRVMVARQGRLLETTADGKEYFIRHIDKPTPVRMGEKRVRTTKA